MREEMGPRVVVDVAGAAVGGSGRFLAELDYFLRTDGARERVEVIGRNRRLTPSWLVHRERLARRARIRVAVNNASFVAPGAHNVVLLRNVLHFAGGPELNRHAFLPSMELRTQVPLIRGAVRRADRIVVPTSAMAERVAAWVPSASSALRVRGHPVTQRDWAGKPGTEEVGILIPVVPAPYKHLEAHLADLLRATDGPEFAPIRITVTATETEMPSVAHHPRVTFTGLLPPDLLDRYWRDSLAIYYPTTLEAFGYPLAEARVNGRHVIAQGTAQNREVAGEALCAFTHGHRESLTAAVRQAISGVPPPDPINNDPIAYFRWLLEGAERQP